MKTKLIEVIPFYNRWALFVTMNKMHSDFSSVILKMTTDSSKYAEICCDLAVAQLKDKDNVHWIRDHYHVSEK